MTELMTVITVPNSRIGVQDYGRLTVAHMIAELRAYANQMRAEIALIDATPDDGFQIKVVRGVHVQRHVETLQAPAPSIAVPGGVAQTTQADSADARKE